MITTRDLFAADAALWAKLNIVGEILRGSGLLRVLGLRTSCCNICTGLRRMPDNIARNTCAPSAFHADHVTVLLWRALLTGLAVWVATALELTTRKACL